MNFRQFLEQNTVGTHNDGPGSGFNPSGGSLLQSDFTGSEGTPKTTGNALHLPSLDLGLPSVNKTGVIKHLELKKNPIFIMLSDGTKLYFTLDEFNRIPGEIPKVGKRMTVKFMRNPNDKTKTTSQIQQIYCFS